MTIVTISNHADDVLGDAFVRASEFYLLGDRDLHVIYGCVNYQEQIGELSVDRGDYLVVRPRQEARGLVDGDY